MVLDASEVGNPSKDVLFSVFSEAPDEDTESPPPLETGLKLSIEYCMSIPTVDKVAAHMIAPCGSASLCQALLSEFAVTLP